MRTADDADCAAPSTRRTLIPLVAAAAGGAWSGRRRIPGTVFFPPSEILRAMDAVKGLSLGGLVTAATGVT